MRQADEGLSLDEIQPLDEVMGWHFLLGKLLVVLYVTELAL